MNFFKRSKLTPKCEGVLTKLRDKMRKNLLLLDKGNDNNEEKDDKNNKTDKKEINQKDNINIPSNNNNEQDGNIIIKDFKENQSNKEKEIIENMQNYNNSESKEENKNNNKYEREEDNNINKEMDKVKDINNSENNNNMGGNIKESSSCEIISEGDKKTLNDNKLWRVGIMCKMDCYHLTKKILKILEKNGYEWKIISRSYKIKCRKRKLQDIRDQIEPENESPLNVLIQIFRDTNINKADELLVDIHKLSGSFMEFLDFSSNLISSIQKLGLIILK